MSKVTITTVSSGYLDTDKLNTNFTSLQTAIENTLSRDGTSPNTMTSDLDLNGKNIINAGAITPASSYNASEVTNVPAGGIAATDVQSAIDELDTEKVDIGSAIAGFTLGGTRRLVSAATGLPILDADANITEGVWTSIGPTGSGADYEWSGLDDIPLSAKGVSLQGSFFSGHSSATNVINEARGRPTGASAATTASTYSIVNDNDNGATATYAGGGSDVPLDASNIFELFWQGTATNRTSIIFNLSLSGFIG